MNRWLKIVCVMFFLMVSVSRAFGMVYWTGNAGDPNWSEGANWFNGTPASSSIVFNNIYDPENDLSVLYGDLTVQNLLLDGWKGDLYLQGNLNVLDSFIMNSGNLHLYSKSILTVGNNFIFNGDMITSYDTPLSGPTVPEPVSLFLFSFGLLGAGLFKRKFRK